MKHLNRTTLRTSLIGATISAAALSATAAADTIHDVDVGPGFSFSPAHITIDTGDTVRWTWIGMKHNVVSGEGGVHDGNFNSGPPIDEPGHVFEVIFDQDFLDNNQMPDNVYPYYCEPHLQFGMIGSVTVLAAKDDCPADLNDDNIVNVLDLLILLESWGDCDDPDDCPADLNSDGTVNVLDLLILLENWGMCP